MIPRKDPGSEMHHADTAGGLSSPVSSQRKDKLNRERCALATHVRVHARRLQYLGAVDPPGPCPQSAHLCWTETDTLRGQFQSLGEET